jgi:hypothetical protein
MGAGYPISNQHVCARPPPGAIGFTNMLAWQQVELYIALALNLVSALAALVISTRDGNDRRQKKAEAATKEQ